MFLTVELMLQSAAILILKVRSGVFSRASPCTDAVSTLSSADAGPDAVLAEHDHAISPPEICNVRTDRSQVLRITGTVLG